MADINGLYSYNGAEPKFLPHEIRLSDGMVRTDPSSFTEEELLDAGYTGPYLEPDFDILTQERNWDSESLSYVVTNRPEIDDNVLKELRWASLRHTRNSLLRDSDYIFIEDSPPIAESKKQEWVNYRQLLRDFPSTIQDIMQYASSEELPWPTQPSK